LPCLLRRGECAEDCGEDKGGGDEGDVHCKEGQVGCDGVKFARGEEAGVGAFEEGDANRRAASCNRP
jgi:hypothetical protein